MMTFLRVLSIFFNLISYEVRFLVAAYEDRALCECGDFRMTQLLARRFTFLQENLKDLEDDL